MNSKYSQLQAIDKEKVLTAFEMLSLLAKSKLYAFLILIPILLTIYNYFSTLLLLTVFYKLLFLFALFILFFILLNPVGFLIFNLMTNIFFNLKKAQKFTEPLKYLDSLEIGNGFIWQWEAELKSIIKNDKDREKLIRFSKAGKIEDYLTYSQSLLELINSSKTMP